jgi:hypothetical protein
MKKTLNDYMEMAHKRQQKNINKAAEDLYHDSLTTCSSAWERAQSMLKQKQYNTIDAAEVVLDAIQSQQDFEIDESVHNELMEMIIAGLI